MRKFFEQSNPWALTSIAETLLEADERDMWDASAEALATLRDAVLEAEGWEEPVTRPCRASVRRRLRRACRSRRSSARTRPSWRCCSPPVEPRLGGVLLRGDKGSAKTTLARGLAALLPGDAPFVELPLGATEDR